MDQPRRTGRALLAGALSAVVAGGALWLTAPPSNLVDIPAYEIEGDEFGNVKTPPLADFYDIDLASWPSAEPGTLAAAEEVIDTPEGFRAWRIIYHSTDLDGNDIPVSAIYVVPDEDPPAGGWPLVAFAHGTLGAGQQCGISHSLFEENTPANTGWDPHIKPMVENGWAVVASDYSGMGAPGPKSYLVGPLEARGVLDSLRAVQQPDPRIGSVPVDSDKIGVYGKSQGGEVAISVLEQAPTYAPELDIKGGVSLAPGFLVPIPGALDFVAGNPTSTSQNYFVMLLAASYADSYPELLSVDDILSEEGMRRLPLVDEFCGSELSDKLSDVPLGDLVNLPVDRGFVNAISQAQPGNTFQPVPLLVQQGLKDVTILPQFTHAQVMARCALGETVMYVRYPEDDHPSLNYQARLSPPYALQWMDARFAGEPAPNNCTNRPLQPADPVEAAS